MKEYCGSCKLSYKKDLMSNFLDKYGESICNKCYSSNSSNSSNGGVILNPPIVKKKKQISPSKKWCFTLNNYTSEEVEELSSKVPLICDKYICAFEVGENQTPHIQGFLNFITKCRPMSKFNNERIHWEKCRGSLTDNINYCSKEGNVFLNKGMPKPVKLMTSDMLRPVQLKIANQFLEDEDELFGRNIYWFYEEIGGWGKSILAKYMVDCMGAMLVQGANNDILCGIQKYIELNEEAPKIIIFDIPRTNENHISFQAIEAIKNGMFFSGKYESGMCRFNSPHILVFANETPDCSKLSQDRWIIEELDHDMELD